MTRGSWVPVLLAVAGVATLVGLRGVLVPDLAVPSEPVAEVVPPEGSIVPAVSRERACRDLRGTVEDRVQSCLAALPATAWSKAASTALDDLAAEGKLVSAVGAPLPGAAISLASEPGLLSLGLGTDEAALAKALRDRGVRGIVVARDLDGALDRDRRVLSRLVQHDHLLWFQLRRVTDDALIYTVRSSESRMPLATGDALLQGLRARLEGRPVPAIPWSPDTVRLIGSFRLQGETLAIRHVVGDTGEPLASVLDDLAGALRREWDRNWATKGLGEFTARLPDLRLEVHVVMERAPIEPRDRWALFDLWEMGVDGMMLRRAEGKDPDQFTFLPGSEATTRSLHEADSFLKYAADRGGWHDLRPWEDPQTRLDLIRDEHFMESKAGGGPAVRLVRGLPEVDPERVDERSIQEMLVSGGEWWLANAFPDGSYEYKYWPDQNRRSDDYNEVRHILGPRDLAATWRYRNDDRYLVGARRGMDWLLQYAVYGDQPADPRMPHPGPGALLFRYPSFADMKERGEPPNQKLGTVAVALLAWIEWARVTGDRSEDERIRQMATFVASMMDENGSFKPYYVPDGHDYEDDRNDIVPGEAALALGQVASYFGEPSWLESYPKFIAWYRPWFRERAAKTRPEGRWPHDTYDTLTRLDLVQFGPWSVMAARQAYEITGNEEAAAFGLEVADWMIDNYQWTAERAPFPDYVGGYYKLPNELPAMQTFCYSEGTAAAYAIATRFRPDAKERYRKATLESIRFLEVMMYDELDSYYVGRPDKVRGGVRYEMTENKIRIDYVGHAMSTLAQYLDARRADIGDGMDTMDAAARGALPPVQPRRSAVGAD